MEINRCMRCMREIAANEAICPHCGHVVGTPERESYHLRQGSILAARYLIGYSLGSGAFGITYAAFDLMLERRVAIKEYLPGDLATRTQGQNTVSVFDGEKAEMFCNGLAKFADEAQRLLSCNAIPGIVKIYDTLRENNTAYIIMEYLDGKTLKEVLADHAGRIKFEEALEYMLPVLSALEEVHKLGLIHRDISPDNIMITEENEPKLFDFGAARYANTETSKSLTVLLKPGYAPEEQYRSRGNQGPWSDVYALAATFYKCITGVTPEEAIERMANDTLKPPSKLGAKLPQDAETAILNALNKEMENRTASAAAFVAELCSQEPVERRQEEQKKNPLSLSTPLKTAIGAVTALLIVVVTLSLTGVINLGALSLDGRNADIVLVPDMVRMTVSEAESILNGTQADKKLLLYVSERQISDVVPANMIMMQSPQGGNRTLRGAALSVTISDGAEVKVEAGVVPEVTYRTEADAKRMLEDAGFVVTITYAESDNVGEGLVISQSVAPGTELEEGTSVAIVVSLGSKAQRTAVGIAESYDDGGNTPPPAPAAHTHEFEDWTETRQATCEEDGVSTGICSCGATETRPIPALGHNYVNAVCSRCKKLDPSHAHSYTWVVNNGATCTTDGSETGACICGDTMTRAIPATGHSYGSNAKCAACGQLDPSHVHTGDFVRTKNPTCTEQGQDSRTCPVCGTAEAKPVPALGHTFVWKVTSTPTCTAAGVETETCSVCGATNGTRSVPKLNHSYSKGYCTRCGAANPDPISIPNIVGLNEADAKTALTNLGFKVSVTQAYNWEVASGKVTAQSATGSGHVGDTITITVSKGTKPFAIGDIVLASGGTWYSTCNGGSSTSYNGGGKTWTIIDYRPGTSYPYRIQATTANGWVPASHLTQRTNGNAFSDPIILSLTIASCLE